MVQYIDMINSTVLNMISVLNKNTILTLEMVMFGTRRTEEFADINALNDLYNAGWIEGMENEDECYWIMTPAGSELYFVLQDLVI